MKLSPHEDERWLRSKVPASASFISSAVVQRLRCLSQLGSASLLYGTAHSRFDHSLGVARLGAQVARELQRKEFNVHEFDIANVAIAGLLHDVGHGPFSHTYDAYVADKHVHHEVRGILVAKHLLQQFAPGRVAWVLHLLAPLSPAYPCPDEAKRFLSNIVHSDDGIDVDRLDYLIRDTACLGVSHLCMIHHIDIVQLSTVVSNRWTVDTLPVAFVQLLRYWLHTAVLGNTSAVRLDEHLGYLMKAMSVPWTWTDAQVILEMQRRGYAARDIVARTVSEPVSGVGLRVIRANSHMSDVAKYVTSRRP